MQHLLGQQLAAPGERAPALGADAVLGVERAQRVLREVRVQLHLVDRGRDPGLVDELGEHRLGEVRDADRADEPALARLDHAAPGVDVLADARVRPVDELQVDAVEPEHRAATLDAGDRLS